MNDRLRVQNVDYDFKDESYWRLSKVDARDRPWRVVTPSWHRRYFRTHAEAIAYADKQIHRTENP